jgi:hypothetical protein
MTSPDRPRTGLRALKAAVNLRGVLAISGRTAAGRALIAWKRALVADLGGEAAISPEQMARVEVAARTRLLLDHVDAHVLGLTSLVSRRGRLKPIVEQRNRLAALLNSQLAALAELRKLAAATDPEERAALADLAARYGRKTGNAESAR